MFYGSCHPWDLALMWIFFGFLPKFFDWMLIEGSRGGGKIKKRWLRAAVLRINLGCYRPVQTYLQPRSSSLSRLRPIPGFTPASLMIYNLHLTPSFLRPTIRGSIYNLYKLIGKSIFILNFSYIWVIKLEIDICTLKK